MSGGSPRTGRVSEYLTLEAVPGIAGQASTLNAPAFGLPDRILSASEFDLTEVGAHVLFGEIIVRGQV